MVPDNHFRLLTLGRLALLTPAGEEDESLGKQRRRLALLAVLALSKRPLPREALAEMFWGDQDEVRARHSLDNALSHFRRVLGGDALARRQAEVGLADEAALAVDAAELAEAVAAKEYGRAAALYRGPLLDGVHIEGSPRFERWVAAERRRLEALFAEACQKECYALARARRWDECAALAARWLDVAPLSADAALYLLNALKAPGTREADRAALAEYRRIRARLEQEYELAPDKSVTALADEIAGRLEESAPAAAAPGPADARPEPSPSAASAATPALQDVAAAPVWEGPAAGAGALTRGRRRWLVPVLALSLLAVVAALAALAAVEDRRREDRAPAGSLLAAGVLSPRERVLVADFENRTADSLLGAVITEAIRVDLRQSSAIRVVPPATVRAVLGRMKRPATAPLDAVVAREVAVREGIKAVVAGEVATVGSRYVLSAQLLSAETGEVLAAGRETADDSTRVIHAVGRLSRRLREQIGESLRSIRATPPLQRVTTSSLEALRKHTLALRTYYVDGDEPKAIALWEAAVALDSTFALAHLALSVVLSNRSYHRARSVEELTKAFRHRAQLTERERHIVEALYYLEVTGEYGKAAAAYRAMLAIFPNDQTALGNLGNAYYDMRDFARAEQAYRRTIEADSTSAFLAYSNLLHLQIIFGRLAEAETTLARARAKFPGHPGPESFATSLLIVRGDYARAEAALRAEREALTSAGDDALFARYAMASASVAAFQGKLGEADRHYREAAAIQEERGAAREAVDVATLAGYLDVWFRGAPKRGIQKVEAALAKHPLAKMHQLDRPYLSLATFFALAGEPARARALVSEFEAIDPALRRREEPARHQALGVIALAEGRRDDAIAEFRLADRGRCPVCAVPDLGRAYDAAGVADSAIAVYERYARHYLVTEPATPRYVPYEASRAGIYKRLGELYEERGDRARAAEYYGRFLAMWKDADAELQPTLRDVERRVARLREPG